MITPPFGTGIIHLKALLFFSYAFIFMDGFHSHF